MEIKQELIVDDYAYQRKIDLMISDIALNEQHLFDESEWDTLQIYQTLDCNLIYSPIDT